MDSLDASGPLDCQQGTKNGDIGICAAMRQDSGMRWTDQKAGRFQELRRAEARGELLAEELAELEALLADLDADESDLLRPALERIRVQAAAMAKETEALDAKARELLRIADL